MTVRARMISMITMLTAFALIVASAYGSTPAKTKTKPEKTVQGTVVTTTDGDLIIRKGKSDVTLMYDAASQKPAALTPGASVLVHYREEKNQRIVTTVALVEAKAVKTSAGKAPAKD